MALVSHDKKVFWQLAPGFEVVDPVNAVFIHEHDRQKIVKNTQSQKMKKNKHIAKFAIVLK